MKVKAGFLSTIELEVSDLNIMRAMADAQDISLKDEIVQQIIRSLNITNLVFEELTSVDILSTDEVLNGYTIYDG